MGVDHATEIDPFSAGAIRIVRGAAGTRFGPDAIGGVIIVILHKCLLKLAHLQVLFHQMASCSYEAGRVNWVPKKNICLFGSRAIIL